MTKQTWRVHDPVFEADEVCELHPVYPWCGHRWFAYDLVRFLRPKRVAELGVHWGTSFFAFCQAAKDGELPTQIHGVDTWRGDDHTGPYSDEVISSVRETVQRFFEAQDVTMHRMTFDEGLEHFDDGSIDLLHIDGFHEYEAVEHDYRTWLPKLADDGIVMFHDVAEDCGYGSVRFWHDVSSSLPGFRFPHSWGLGVLFPKGNTNYLALQRRGLSDKLRMYEYRAELDLTKRRLKDTGEMARERFNVIDRQSQRIGENKSQLEKVRAELKAAREQQRKSAASNARTIDELRQQLGHAESAQRAQASRAAGREARLTHMLRQQSRDIERRDAELRAAKVAVAAQRARRDALRRTLRQREATMNQQSEAIHRLRRRLQELELHVEVLATRADHVESIVADHRRRLGDANTRADEPRLKLER
ncbi:MAG: class I SAM-dependent methyltransferase [Planctomycetota bacterium]